MRQHLSMTLVSSVLLGLAGCATSSGADWWRLCDCSEIRDLDDCVVNEDPDETEQVTSSGELVEDGEAPMAAAGGPAVQLASLGAALAPAAVNAEVCLYPVEAIAVGGATAAGGVQHVLLINGLNSQAPVAKLKPTTDDPAVDVEVDSEPVLTSYSEMGWSIVESEDATYLYVHGGEPTDGDRGRTNGVRIRLSKPETSP